MSKQILHNLGQRLDEQSSELSRLDSYYQGKQPLSFLSPEAKTALGNRLTRMAVNVPRLAVGSMAERLTVLGFTRGGQPDEALMTAWERSGMDEGQHLAHREALALGRGFVIVWAGGENGSPRVTVESAHQVAAERDPATRQVTAAVKRWSIPDPSQPSAPERHVAVTYEPDVITRYETRAGSPPTDAGAWKRTETVGNPLGVVPVVPIVNSDRLLDLDGRSEFHDLIPLVDALDKLLADMMVTSEFYSRPRRWATGVEIPVDEATGESINPFASEADRTWISEAAESKFGQFAATDLAAYDNAVKVIMQQISAVSALPEHYLGITTDNPSSADAIRSAEASLVARAIARQRTFGKAWADVAALMLAVSGGTPAESVEVVWESAESRTPAQTADSVSKLVQTGILPVSEALTRLGYSPDEVARIRAARRGDAADNALSRLGAVQ